MARGKYVWLSVVQVLALFIVSSSASGEVTTPLEQRMRKRVSLDFRDLPIDDVIRIIAEQVDVDIVKSPKVTGTITTSLSDVPAEEALRQILKAHGCGYMAGKHVLTVATLEEIAEISACVGAAGTEPRLQKPVSLDFRDFPIDDAIRIIANQAQLNIVKSPKVAGTVTAQLTDVPVEEALRHILMAYGYAYVVDKDVVRIAPMQEIAEMSGSVATTGVKAGRDSSLPEPGPENGGLRLRLSVITTRKGGNDYYSVQLGIINVGSSAVTLVAPPRNNYGTYLKSAVLFITFPEVLPRGGQTAERQPDSGPPKTTIEPQQEFAVDWRSSGRLLKQEDYLNTTPYFPGPGLYSVRAKVVVLTEDGKEILLYSNQQPVSVGGSLSMPKHAAGRVINVNPQDGTVTINLGAQHRIKKGDKFMVMGGAFSYWELTVNEVMDWHSKATSTPHVSMTEIGKVPPRQATAQLMAF